MDASKLKNGSGTVHPAKSGQPSAVRSEAKKVDKSIAGKKPKTGRPRPTAVRSSKPEKLVCRYCGSDYLAPSFFKRRDRRCRKCFSKRYGSAVTSKKAKVKR